MATKNNIRKVNIVLQDIDVYSTKIQKCAYKIVPQLSQISFHLSQQTLSEVNLRQNLLLNLSLSYQDPVKHKSYSHQDEQNKYSRTQNLVISTPHHKLLFLKVSLIHYTLHIAHRTDNDLHNQSLLFPFLLSCSHKEKRFCFLWALNEDH